MFGLDFSELILIGVIALIVVGPKDLPRVARAAGLLMGRVRRYVSDVKSEISKEMELSDLKQMKDQFEESAHELRSVVNEQAQTIQSQLEKSAKDLHDTVNEQTQTIQSELTQVTETLGENKPAPTITPEKEMAHSDKPETLDISLPAPITSIDSTSQTESETLPEHDENQLDLFAQAPTLDKSKN